MSIEELVKTETKFLKEKDCEKNENGIYVYKSANEADNLRLDCFLNEYKSWLEEKGLIKIL